MKKIVACAMCVLALLLALFLSWTSQQRTETASASAPGKGDEATQPSVVEPTPSPAEATDERAAVAVVAPEPDPASAPAPDLAPRALQVVRVVDRATGVPVPHAEVLALRVSDLELSRMRTSTAPGTRRIGSLEARLEREGERARADEHGVARIQHGGGRLAILGRAPGQFGFGVRPGDLPHELRLELAPDVSVEVDVVDGAGAPVAGVPVAFRLNNLPPDYEEPVLTDAAGRASLPHASLQRTGLRTLTVAVAACLSEPVERSLDPAALPAQPIRLVLPPTGSLELIVRDRDGSSAGDGHVLVQRSFPQVPGEPVKHRGDARLRMQEGRALLPHVALATDLRLVVQPDRSPFVSATHVVAGPARAGERKTVEITLGADYPTIRLRVLDEQGLPLKSTALSLLLGPPDKLPGGMQDHKRSDEAGILELDLYSGFPGPGPGPWRLIVMQGEEAGGPARQALRELASYAPGVHDLGDLQLRPVNLLARGLALDALQAPLSGANVVAQVFDPDGRFGARSPPQWRWTALMSKTDAEGRFALHGELPAGRFAVLVTYPGLLETRVECEPGSQDVRVVLPAQGTIVGRVLLDPGMEEESIQIRGQVEGVTPTVDGPRSTAMTAPRRDGTFALSELRVERWAVSVMLTLPGAPPVELRKIEGIDVRGGEPVRDPRLDPLDLRGAAFPIQLHLGLPPGASQLSGFCEWRQVGSPAAPTRLTPRDGVVHLLAPGAPLEVGLIFFGYRPVRLEAVSSDQSVALVAGLDLRLRLPEGLQLPAPPARLMADFSVKGPLGTDAYSSATPFDAAGEVSFRACGPGPVRVRLRFVAPSGPERHAVGTEWREVQLVESDTEQVFLLDVTQEQIDAALAGARR